MAPSRAPASDKKTRSAAPPPVQASEPSRLEMLYRDRAARSPTDIEAFQGLALLEVRRGDYTDAIIHYGRVLELSPRDRDAQMGLAHALMLAGEYAEARVSFQSVLRERPADTEAQDGWARAQVWSGHAEAALPVFRELAARYPANPEYGVALARVQMDLHQYSQAGKTLAGVLSAHPHDHDARLQFAYLELYEGHAAEALRGFNRLIAEDPTDAEALKGNVRGAYYRGDLVYARKLAGQIVEDYPRDADAILLLAALERALHHTRQARALLYRAEAAAPADSDVAELEKSLRGDSHSTLHTSSSVAREVGSGNPGGAEDLTSFGYEETWGFFALPRSSSFLSLAYLPSQSPSGGIQGAAGPAQVLYRQTTFVTTALTVRGGFGMARFGPGDLVGIPTQERPIISAKSRPVGFAGFSYLWNPKLTVDFNAARAAITYTPTAVRLGITEDRLSAGLDDHLTPNTVARVEPFVADDFTISYNHALGTAGTNPAHYNAVDHNRGGGAAITLDHSFVQRRTFSLGAGYSGLAYEILGGAEKPYLGIFNPSFYQRHYLTTRVKGKLRGPLGFDFSAGGGVQQINHDGAIKPALLVNPAFTLRVNPRLSLALGYTHYDSSQALGTLNGNAVRLSTDCKF